jgi:hypothetical protein
MNPSATFRPGWSESAMVPPAIVRRDRALAFFSTFLYLLSFTKFRERDPGLTLSGQLDSQILFEVGAYLILAAVVIVYMMRLRHREVRMSRVEVLLFAFVFLAAVSSLWSSAPGYTALRSSQLLLTALLPWLFMRTLPTRLYVVRRSSPIASYSPCSPSPCPGPTEHVQRTLV